MESAIPSLPIRAWRAWRERGSRYAWHKALRRTLEPWPGLKRRLVYSDPRLYWTLRGGRDYFREQEAQAQRSLRSEWLADRIASYQPRSVLEIGCGYGKQLAALRRRLGSDVRLVGVDFSPTQLAQAQRFLAGQPGIELVLGSGDQLPFVDGSFELTMTSAVILHNPPEIAERMRREAMRVSSLWTVHNEDVNTSYNRYGYDTAAWYRSQGLPVREAGPIPLPDPEESAASQFCAAGPWSSLVAAGSKV